MAGSCTILPSHPIHPGNEITSRMGWTKTTRHESIQHLPSSQRLTRKEWRVCFMLIDYCRWFLLVDPSASPITVGDADLPGASPSESPTVASNLSLSPLQQLNHLPEFPPYAVASVTSVALVALVTSVPLPLPISDLVPVALTLPVQQSAVECPTVAPVMIVNPLYVKILVQC